MREQKRTVNLSLSLSLFESGKKETPNARARSQKKKREEGIIIIIRIILTFSDFRDPKSSFFFLSFFIRKKTQNRKDVDAERDNDAKKTPPRATTPPLTDPSLGRRVCAPSERGVFRSEEQSQ